MVRGNSICDISLIISQGPKNIYFGRNTACIAAVAEYVEKTLSALGISEVDTAEGSQNMLTDVIDDFVNFRQTVRNRVLEQEVRDKVLLGACDEARNNLLVYRIQVKVRET